MDNWDYFGENLEVARNSEGELDKQAEIYAESWQAASNRVRAALEGIYGTLVDDESFIDVLNTIEKIITYFDNLIDTVGGLSGVLTTLGVILTKVFSNQLAQSISNIAYNIKMLKPGAQEAVQQEKANTLKEFAGIMAASEGEANSTAGQTASQVYTEKLNLQEKMISNANRMSEAEKQQIQILMDQLSIQEKQTIEAAKQVDITKNKKSDAASKIYANAAQKDMNAGQQFNVKAASESMSNVATSAKSLNLVSNILKNLNKESDQFDQQLYEITKTMQNMANQDIGIDFSDDLVTLSQLLDVLRNSDTESDNWAVTLQQIQGLFAGINQQAIDNTATETGSEIDEVREYSQAVIAADNAVDRLEQSQNDLSTSNTKVGQSIDQAQGKIKTWADSLVSFANGALSIVSALQMVGGIVDTLENPDMSAWEKVLSIGSSVLMMVTMLIPTFTTLMGAFGGTGAAAAGATGPVAGFGVALNTALGPIGWVALALTALVAIFAVVATSIDTASEKAQKKFNQMSEDAKYAADALSEAEDSYNNLQDTVNAYSDARDNIDSLTQGTQEFKDAILEANDAARDLIELYGVTSRYNANTGLIEIDENELDKAIELEQIKLENARVSNVAAQSNKLMASSDLSNAKIVEQNDKSYLDRVNQTITPLVATMATAGAGAAAAGMVTTALAPFAGLIGSLIGAVGSFAEAGLYILGQNNTNEKEIAALESLQDAYIQSGGNFEVAMDSLSESEKSLIDSLGLTDNELANLCSEVSANTAAVLQNNKQLIDYNFADNKEYQNSKYKDQLNTMMADELANETNRIYEEKWKDGAPAKIIDEKAQKDYAEMMGYTWVKNKGNNLGVYSKGDGSADFTVSDETARRALAQKDAMEALGQSVEKYNQTLETVNQTGEKFGDGVGDLMLRLAGGQGASFADATSDEIKALQQAIDDAEVATDIISDEDAQNMGYDNAETYVKALQLGIDSYTDGLANVGKNLSSSISKDFLNEVEELTLSGAQSMAGNLDKAFKLAGSEVANTLDDIFVGAGEDADELSALLEGVDWGDPNAVAKLNAEIQKQGLDVDTSSASWKAYTEAMSAAGMAIGGVQSKFDALRQTMADTSDITKSLKTNDIISDDDYKKLLEINPAIKEMFMITAEGYRFLGNKKDLSALLIGNAKDNIAGVKEQFAALRAEGEEIANSNWFDSDGKKTINNNNNDLANMANDVTDMDAALAYMGISKESLQEAADYILEFTDENGNILTDATNFDQSKYDQYVQLTQDVYTQLANIRQQYLDDDFSAEQAEQLIASTATNIVELQQLQADGAIGAEAFNQQLNVLTTEAFNAAQSLDELKGALQLSAEMGGEIDYTAYADNLMRIAEGYENCAKEVEKYQLALANDDGVESAQAALETAIMIGESSEKYGLEAKEIEVQAQQLAKAYDLDAEAAAKLAINNQRMNKGIVTLAENWKDWSKALKASDKTSLDWADAAVECTAAIADLVGASQDLELPDDFFNTDNMALLEAAIDGDTDAINRLGAAVAAAQVEMLDFNESFADLAMQTMADNGLEIDITLDSTQFDADKALVLQGIDDIKNGVLSAGGEMDAEWVAALNRMALDTGMSVDDMNSLLGSLGVQAKVKTTYVKQPMEVPTYTDHYEATNYNPPEYDEKGEMIRPASWSNRKYTVPGEPLKVEGYAAVAQISTEDNPLTAEIESSTTTAGSPHSSGATYTGNRGSVAQSTKDAVKDSKKKSGGGKKDSTKKKEDEIERYHKINKEIDAINRKMDRAAGAKDAAFGRDKLPYIQQEIDAIDKLIDKHQEYKNEVATNLAADKDKIKGFGFIDENADGILDNWEQVMEEQLRIYNEAAKAYDSGTLSEEAFKEASDKYEEFEKLVEQYEETYELWEEALAKEEELVRERISKELEEITTKVDFEIEIKQRDLDRLERIVDRLSRDTNNMIEIIDKLGEQVNAYGDQSQWYINGIQRIQQNATSEGRELTDEEQRKIWEYQDALEEINDSLEDIIETVENSLLEEFERWNSEIDENISRFDTYSSTLEHYSEIIKLSGRATKDSALLMSLQMQKTSIAMQELNAVYDKYQANLDAQKNVKEKLDLAISSGDAEDIEYWQKQYDEITKTVEKNAEEVAATWQDALQAASDEFDFVVEQTIQKLKDSISEFGLDGLADRYEKAKTINEQYLSDLDKEYELNKLIRQVEGSIDETDNLNAKRELIKLLDEINEKTAEGVKLSQYDLEYMQAEYELELAKLALEEARNAKTSVRLQRGDDGNYSYVYTADQEAIANAEQNYEDKLHAIKTLSQNHIDEMSDLIIQNEQELMEALAAVDRTKFETEEAYQAELNRITEYYYERDTYLRNELNKAVQNMGLVYGDTILGQLENCSTWEQAQDQLKTNTNAAITTMVNAWSKWKSDTETAMSMVGTSSNTLTNTIQTDAAKIATATSNLANTIDTQTSNMKKYIDGLIEKIWEWRDEYLAAIRAMQNTNSSFSSNIAYDPNADYSALMGSVDYGSDEYNIYKGYREQKVNDPNYTGKGKNVSTARVDAFLRNGHTLAEIGKEYYTELTEDEWIKYAGFKTGGYTGEWGPEGKLAYLHEKELVLNAKDTQNILNAVDLVRTISQKLDRQAQIAALGFASKANAHNGTNDNQTIQVEQDVTIHAEFPNATDQNEIKEAILGLVNYTAQYVAKR